MGISLRTKNTQIALILRITSVLFISCAYLIVALLSVGNRKAPFDVTIPLGNGHNYHSRHLLAVDLNATLSSSNETTIHTTLRTSIPLDSLRSNSTTFRNCTPAAINEFPPDGFTREERKHGWVIIHVTLACYLFIFLAIVCEDYFIPCIKKLCDVLHLKEDIAGATFMATASSSAEIFINSVGTFITQGDLGVGTIVGSAVFNILAVPACCGFFASVVLNLEWYPITRDSLVYACSVILLIAFLQDGKIYYYEALILVLFYAFYLITMLFNESICAYFHKVAAKVNLRGYYKEISTENHPLLFNSSGKVNHYNSDIEEILSSDVTLRDIEEVEESVNIWQFPDKNCSKKQKFWWTITWPISFVLYMTTPTTKNYPKMYIITFIMCVIWIGGVSYIVTWLITIIGLTFLAAGSSVPEAVSSVIVSNQGHGSMGISSSIGSNTFDILLCLGVPWFIKSAYYPKVKGEHWIIINSQGINYSAFCLLTTLVLLYTLIYFNRFKLDRKISFACLIMYVAFLVFASLMELNVFFPVNLLICDR
ncbi:sodium/potassium/calcium exchanger 4-like isoform X2 [Euwallacea fornicatus]|uniref:sodium/potassium/calcium exchanger 4-like isoform X2 n=1 Tax=Euwallacea fornicatus TaxID=995702 RepID=UPI00338F77A2